MTPWNSSDKNFNKKNALQFHVFKEMIKLHILRLIR